VFRSSRHLPRVVSALAACAGLAAAAVAQAPPPVFKLLVEEPGVYRVSYEDLVAAGLDRQGIASEGLALTDPAGPVPIWMEDGGDGAFDAGDWIEFVGEHLAGELTYLNEHSRYNVYFLRLDGLEAARMTLASARPVSGEPTALRFQALERERHFEKDLLLLRLPPAPDGHPDELWYWAKLAHNQAEPWAGMLDLGDLESDPARPVTLRIQFRGWSRPRSKVEPELPDHRVEVALNGAAIGVAEWSGPAPYLLEILSIPAERWVVGDNVVELKVPTRMMGEEATPLIDVVMLNWIEVVHPYDGRVRDRQARFDLVVESEAMPVRLWRDPAETLLVFGLGGSRSAASEGGEAVELAVAGESSFFAATPDGLLSPEAIELDRPSALRDPRNRADYIMISHRRLLEAIGPLADFHRSRGLSVEVVDVQDVYDEFNHGVVHPRALRSFVDHAYHRWARPAPRFVLLVGDASWDGKNTLAEDDNYADWTYRPGETVRFGKNQSTPYAEGAELNNRHLVPTWNLPTYEGHSASDNWFVMVDGDDSLPDLAIGRLPVVEPAEVARIVAKTIRYAAAGEVGPWRRNALFITNESRQLQRQSDWLAGLAARGGLSPRRVYPESSEVSNEHHTRTLIDSFDEGQLIVHFIGHGGRYIWRTGPPDLQKNHDLFSLDDLDRLRPSGRLPVVLSMTCYSAPFDHPSADSIGEKLLRLDERGAVAVLAASWRNAPRARWGKTVIEELLRPGATIGEAVLRAKRRIGERGANRSLVETYNLLGDPAVPVALPAGEIALVAAAREDGEGGGLRIEGRVGLPGFAGSLRVELMDGKGDAVRGVALELDSPAFAAELEATPEELAASTTVRAYAWNGERNLDAVGAVHLAPPPPPPAAIRERQQRRREARRRRLRVEGR
jgi:hypothetical protein